MLKDKSDAEWHVRIWKISLKVRDECHPATWLWDFFDDQAKRIKARIDEFISVNPEMASLIEAPKKKAARVVKPKQKRKKK